MPRLAGACVARERAQDAIVLMRCWPLGARASGSGQALVVAPAGGEAVEAVGGPAAEWLGGRGDD